MSGAPERLLGDSYEHFALVYDAAGLDRFSLGFEARVIELFEGDAPPRIVDLACGTGSLLARLAGRAACVGVDASPAMVRRAAAKGSAARFASGSFRALPLRGPFDILLCLYDSLNYLLDARDLAAVFREIRRVAAPGAAFLFDTNDRAAYESIWGSPEPFVAETPAGTLTIRSGWDAARGVGEAEVVVEATESGVRRTYVSRHRQRYHAPDDVERALAEAGWATARREPIEPFPGEEVLPGGKTLWTARPRGSP